MKWPELLLMIRHDVSAYNVLSARKKKSRLYKEFLAAFDQDPNSDKARILAAAVQEEFALDTGDANTELLDREAKRATEVGIKLRRQYRHRAPHVIFVSPYKRTKLTLEGLVRGWPELAEVKVVEDERIREQEHGLALLYNDWRVFHATHPDQGRLYMREGAYWYRYPQGESVPDVRERNRSWIGSVVRDFAGKRLLAVTHHLTILATRANFERWDAERFVQVDRLEKPINCGVTAYRGDASKGRDGHFVLDYYNRRLYRR